MKLKLPDGVATLKSWGADPRFAFVISKLRWVRGRWRHALYIVFCCSIIYIGYSHLRQDETNHIDLFSQIADPQYTIISKTEEHRGGRLKHIDLWHYYKNDRNEIRVIFQLKEGANKGFVLLEMDVIPEYEVLLDEFSVYRHGNIANGLCIEYDKDTPLKGMVTLTFPSIEFTQLGSFSFEIPHMYSIDNTSDFTVAYSFFPSGDSTVSVSGTRDKPMDGPDYLVGHRWPDSRSVTPGTSVTVTSPFLQRQAQVSFALGAILLAIGINLITSYAYAFLGKYVRTVKSETA